MKLGTHYIIPCKFYNGDLGELREENKELWDALVSRDKLDWEKRKEGVEQWKRDNDML